MHDPLKVLDANLPGDVAHLQLNSQTIEPSQIIEPDLVGAPPAIGMNTDAKPAEPSELRSRVLDWLAKTVPESRLQHILRVEAMAIALAEYHQLSVPKAAQAGLMHDLAKFFKPARLLEMARAEGLEIDAVEVANPHLLHAEVGAIVARDEFGIHDVEILNAIRNHTLGRPGMDKLSCVVFLADSLEPGRGDAAELTTLRRVSYENLYQAVWLTCDESLRYLLSTRLLIHPRTVQTRNWFLQMTIRSSTDSPP